MECLENGESQVCSGNADFFDHIKHEHPEFADREF